MEKQAFLTHLEILEDQLYLLNLMKLYMVRCVGRKDYKVNEYVEEMDADGMFWHPNELFHLGRELLNRSGKCAPKRIGPVVWVVS